MKKLVFTISVLCYFAVTSGIVINSHYCMKRLVSVNLFDRTPDICGKCGMDTHESNGCCRDEVKVVKLQQDQVSQAVVSLTIPPPEKIVSTPSQFLVALFQHIEVPRHFHNHSPPLLARNSLYLENRVFRI